jgi:hypothetical protein
MKCSKIYALLWLVCSFNLVMTRAWGQNNTNDIYNLVPGEKVIATNGVTVVTEESYATGVTKLEIKEVTTPEHEHYRASDAVGKYYSVFSPDIEQLGTGFPDNHYWLGLPVPEGVDGTKLWIERLTFDPYPLCGEGQGECNQYGWGSEYNPKSSFYHPATLTFYAWISGYPSNHPQTFVLVQGKRSTAPIKDVLPW